MRHQHRNLGLFQHVAGGAAQDRLAEARVAVGAHDQKVGVLVADVAGDLAEAETDAVTP